jgi:hypothetical protein
VLLSLAAAIALGAIRMNDIALLAHLAPVLGDARGGRRSASRLPWPALRPPWTGSPA